MERVSTVRRHFLLLLSVLVAGLLVSLTLGQVNGVAGRGLGSAVPPPGQPGSVYLPLEEVALVHNRYDNSRVLTTMPSLLGPGICTSYGDPFSPDNPWVSQDYLFTYRYRIVIPADYEVMAGTERLRVEILDPDSVNLPPHTNLQIVHTRLFSEANPEIGQTEPPRTCSANSDQKDACLRRSCEWQAQGCSGVVGFGLEAINPYWIYRMDENRGAGSGNGNGLCDEPGSYSVKLNTAIRFDLVYPIAQAGVVSRQWLASYTGQTDDPGRDHDGFSHGTDLNWTSPGSFNAFGAVPTDCGSPLGGYSLPGDDADMNGFDDPGSRCEGLVHRPVATTPGTTTGFELDLSLHLPDIFIDPAAGDRILYVDVTALSGAAENDYMIWAGPPADAAPANVNLRNVHIIDEGVMDPAGVRVENINALNMNAMFTNNLEMPLLTLDARYAGTTVTVSLFDPDAGTAPPATFYYDTIPQQTFLVQYTTLGCWGTTGCNNQWLGPPGDPDSAFQIPVPDYFVSGTLMMAYQQGGQDTFTFVVQTPPLPATPTQLSLTPAVPGPVQVQPGEHFSLTFQVNNAGPVLGGSLNLSETIPAGLELVLASASGIFLFEPSLGSPLWQLSDVAPASQGLITLSWHLPLTVTPGTVLTHTLGLQSGNDATSGDDEVITQIRVGWRTHLPVIVNPQVEKR